LIRPCDSCRLQTATSFARFADQNRVIERAEISSSQLHLSLYFDDGTVLVLNGSDTKHHWDLGVAFALPGVEEWNVMVHPDGQLEVSYPARFSRAVRRST
jgi:hypothetical protein